MRYRAGWLIHKKVLALTHFLPVVSPKDYMDITATISDALLEVDQEFHVLIDNRIIADVTVMSLEALIEASPLFRHPQLRWTVIVLPEPIKDRAGEMKVQQQGSIQLIYVNCLDAALAHFQAVDETLDWSARDTTFFTNSEQE